MKKRLSGIIIAFLIAIIVVPFTWAMQSSQTLPPGTEGDSEQEVTEISSFNERLAILVASNGRFNIGAFPDFITGGSTSESWDLTYSWPRTPGTSFTTFRIDGVDNVYGDSGTVVQAPANTNQHTNQSKWIVGDIEITQTLQIVLNNQTNEEDVAKISYDVKKRWLGCS